MRIFSVNAWRFAAVVGVGKWDRFTSWGDKVKDGESAVRFDENTLGQIVDNFAARQNDIAMCYDHQSAYVEANGQAAPALAWYSALALVVDGKVTRFATHDDNVTPPDTTGLDNGIYGYRSEITPLGEQLLPNYKYISPMFTDEGLDEQGNPIGYDLLDVAATNTPFQDGVGLTFHRQTKMALALPSNHDHAGFACGDKVKLARDGIYTDQGEIVDFDDRIGMVRIQWQNSGTQRVPCSMLGVQITKMDRTHKPKTAKRDKAMNVIKMDDSALYKRLGLDDDATPDQAMAAMRALLKKMDDDAAALKKMADADGDNDGDGATSNYGDPVDSAGGMAKKMDDATPSGLYPDPNKKPITSKKMDDVDMDDDTAMDDVDMDDDTAMRKMAKQLGCKPKLSAIASALSILKLSTAPKTEIAAMSKRVAELESKIRGQEADQKRAEAVTFARKAIADGRWNREEESDLVEARIENPKLAEKCLAPKGTWTILKTYTRGGDPIGKDHQAPEDFAAGADEDEIGAGAAVAARKLMSENKGMTLAQAYEQIGSTKPQLYRRTAR